jgi:hypothetical protein
MKLQITEPPKLQISSAIRLYHSLLSFHFFIFTPLPFPIRSTPRTFSASPHNNLSFPSFLCKTQQNPQDFWVEPISDQQNPTKPNKIHSPRTKSILSSAKPNKTHKISGLSQDQINKTQQNPFAENNDGLSQDSKDGEDKIEEEEEAESRDTERERVRAETAGERELGNRRRKRGEKRVFLSL